MFTVVFTKKDGTLRTMNARRGVKKHLRGGNSTIAGKEHLMSVYDLKAEAYRCINLPNVQLVKAGGLVKEF